MTAGEESVVRAWTVPAPVVGEIERIRLWVQVVTGSQLEPDGRVRLLSAETWLERHQRLALLGGSIDPNCEADGGNLHRIQYGSSSTAGK
jgi:hypothetical protein